MAPAYTEFLISHASGSSPVNGGGPTGRTGANDGPIVTLANVNCVDAGAPVFTLEDMDGGAGSWGTTAVGDWVCVDTLGNKYFGYVTELTSEHVITIVFVSTSYGAVNACTVNVGGYWGCIQTAATRVFVTNKVITAAAAGSPTLLTVGASHGFLSSQRVHLVGLAGGTWSTLNGPQIITATAATTITVTVDSSGYGTYTASSGQASAGFIKPPSATDNYAPRINAPTVTTFNEAVLFGTNAGTAAYPICVEGYTTTPGDIDSEVSTVRTPIRPTNLVVRLATQANPIVFTFGTVVTFTNATNIVTTSTATAYLPGQEIVFAGTTPTEITAGTTYYLCGAGTANTYWLYTTKAAAIASGTKINLSDDGSGTITGDVFHNFGVGQVIKLSGLAGDTGWVALNADQTISAITATTATIAVDGSGSTYDSYTASSGTASPYDGGTAKADIIGGSVSQLWLKNLDGLTTVSLKNGVRIQSSPEFFANLKMSVTSNCYMTDFSAHIFERCISEGGLGGFILNSAGTVRIAFKCIASNSSGNGFFGFAQVEECAAVNNSGSGCAGVMDGVPIIIRNNIFVDNGTHGMSLNNATQNYALVNDNIIAHNGTSNVAGTITADSPGLLTINGQATRYATGTACQFTGLEDITGLTNGNTYFLHQNGGSGTSWAYNICASAANVVAHTYINTAGSDDTNIITTSVGFGIASSVTGGPYRLGVNSYNNLYGNVCGPIQTFAGNTDGTVSLLDNGLHNDITNTPFTGTTAALRLANNYELTPAAKQVRQYFADGTSTYPDLGAIQSSVPGAAINATLAKETGANARGGVGTCAKLTPASTSFYGYWNFYVPATAATPFTLKFWHKISAAWNGLLKVSIYDTDQTTLKNTSESVTLTDDAAYHQFSATPVTPTTTGLCLVRIEIIDGASTGYVYIDDISVV